MKARQYVGATLTGAMASTALLGSLAGLTHFASKGLAYVVTVPLGGGIDLPLGTWAFVAGIDGLAISLTVQVHDEDGIDWWAAAGLVAVTLFSAVLQFIAAPDGWQAKTVHTAPAPCAGLAAAFFFRSVGRKHDVADTSPEETLTATSGALDEEGPAPGPAPLANAVPPPAPGVPLEKRTPPRRSATAPRPSASRGQGERGRSSRTGPAPVKGDELVRRVAVWLTENERTLSARSVEAAVKSIRGSCARTLRDEVYAALSEPDALDTWATSVRPDSAES